MYYDKLNRWGWPQTGRVIVILKRKYLETTVNQYKNRIELDLTSNEMFEIAKWCKENINGDWLVGTRCSGFNIKEDAMAFKLRWL